MSGAPRPPIVFVGPSIGRAEVERLCPGLDLRPPIRRGDLYQEREKGAWGFLIIDGAVMRDETVSPREVVDVLEDGALVIGAAGVGALRAADCWPAGARGIGLIYRLYRLGVLESDEEVAVAAGAEGSDGAASLSLVNVRYAVSRAVRRGLLDRATARDIVSAAAAISCPERTWPTVLRSVGQVASDLPAFCAGLDLQRQDAERALIHAVRMLGDAAALASGHRRRGDVPFARSELTRERGHDATGGVDREKLPGLLLAWLIGSGRFARHASRLSLPLDAATVDFDGAARAAWLDLQQANELDAELMRLQAVERASRAAAEAGLAPRPRDLRMARDEIAGHHGFRRWSNLLASPRGRQFAAQIASALERLARAKRMRDAWFNPASKDARERMREFLGRFRKA